MTPPIVGADLWQQVMDTAGHRCECKGACGKKHLTGARKPGRCENEHADQPTRRLIAIPRDPTAPFVEAARLPASRLIAFCPACAGGVRRAVNRAIKAQPPQEDVLFAVDANGAFPPAA